MRGLTPLPPERVAALSGLYAAASGSARRRTLASFAVLAVLALLAGLVAEVRPLVLVANIGKFTAYIEQIWPPIGLDHPVADMRAWYWGLPGWLALLGETLLMAYLGTLLGAVAGFALSFVAAANLVRSAPVRFLAKRVLEVCRTIPDVVFALLFVIAFGLGPMVGVLALAIHTTGALGKLFSEVVENIDMRPVEGLSASGASWLETVRFAVLPQVLSNFVSYGLLRFEINVRGAAVLGFVGAGGIGQEFLAAIRNFYYADVSAILGLIILTVVGIDLATEQVRHRLTGLEEAR
ncbi:MULTISPECIES: phosphonate ABC transporter, permease protein PhnE [unclassified Methylobacterium]|uniref:phosphonate ABC transporter, permease protein PhnE n=1 Tax=unclassified Methylobacterium TaxID=2615210 RepID=UPI0011C1EC19|nr:MULTISPECIES: phosphonate ABC transporter, permease protein PhnE [unclassified Methylobacterium]QEE41957.1 phosphonate ABC transporter, permease protein PhnE [Methylobacterium sp. WL1]TXN54547.1 phosphonate ABC transporter, permease protein PhnE [Methylobacterium sp. WL2]